MKVRGRSEEMTPQEYAHEIAHRVEVHMRHSLAHLSEDHELPDPAAVVEAMDMAIGLPGEDPNELAALLGPFWTGARTRQALGLNNRQALASRVASGSVLALKSADGDLLYPVAQFHKRPDGTIEVKPALVPFLRTLRTFDPWAVGVLLHTPAPELGGLTPLDWARKDRTPDTLTALAQTVAHEWAAGAA